MQDYLTQTKRLGLRLLEKGDIQYLEKLESDPDIQRFSPSGAKTYEQTEALINECISDYEEKGLPLFLLFDRTSSEFIGRAGFFLWKTGDIEVGYCLHRKFWGHGYATEALSALLEWARENIDTDFITACSAAANVASLCVLEKCDMEYFKTEIEDGVKCEYYRIKIRQE